MKPSLWILASAALGLIGCAPATRVTLLPQADGAPSAVAVQSAHAQLELDQPYASARLDRAAALVSERSNAEQIQARHGRLLAAMPRAAQNFTLYFETGTTRFIPESESNLQTVLNLAMEHPGSDIVIIGHTDQVGGQEINDQLSLERARTVRELLIERGFDPSRIEAVGRGSREPLVDRPAGNSESRNRRTEIILR